MIAGFPFASFPYSGNPWIPLLAWLAGIVVAIAVSFGVAGRFGRSKTWVFAGMCLGAIGFAAAWHFLALPLGAAVGAVVGCVAAMVLGR
jgi:hypothetical protein